MIKFRILHEQKLIAVCILGKTSIEDIMRLREGLRTEPFFSKATIQS